MKKIASKLANRLKKLSNQNVVQLSEYKEQKQVVNDLIKEIAQGKIILGHNLTK